MGIARADASRAFELGEGGSAAHQKIRQNRTSPRMRNGLPLQPFVIQQTSDDGDKLVRDWPAATTGVERNYGYMFQWWAMAAAALGFRPVPRGVRRRSRPARERHATRRCAAGSFREV